MHVPANNALFCVECLWRTSIRLQSTRKSGGVAVKPGRPLAVKVEGTSVSLEWTAPEVNGGYTVTGYVIRYGLAVSDAGQYATERVDQASRTSHTISGKLTAKTDYRFAVAAVNKAGEGPQSDFSDVIRTKTGNYRIRFRRLMYGTSEAFFTNR